MFSFRGLGTYLCGYVLVRLFRALRAVPLPDIVIPVVLAVIAAKEGRTHHWSFPHTLGFVLVLVSGYFVISVVPDLLRNRKSFLCRVSYVVLKVATWLLFVCAAVDVLGYDGLVVHGTLEPVPIFAGTLAFALYEWSETRRYRRPKSGCDLETQHGENTSK